MLKINTVSVALVVSHKRAGFDPSCMGMTKPLAVYLCTCTQHEVGVNLVKPAVKPLVYYCQVLLQGSYQIPLCTGWAVPGDAGALPSAEEARDAHHR